MSDSEADSIRRWDPDQYARFRSERSQPFVDLVARIPNIRPRTVADLGCGTGALTRTLHDRWPKARIFAVDHSEQMLAEASRAAETTNLEFVQADLATWSPPEPVDCVISNAAFQWVPDHEALLNHVSDWLSPGGVIAVQIPNNSAERAYDILNDLLEGPVWKPEVRGGYRLPSLQTPRWYAEQLLARRFTVDLWETIYYHRMESAAGVLEWLKGTTLRPVLGAIDESRKEEFLSAFSERLETAYKTGPAGTWFPFRRLFFVARSTSDSRADGDS